MAKYIRIIFKLLFGYPIYWISGFIPRNNKIWVFGSFGVFNDNSSYLYQYLVDKQKKFDINVIWISSNKKSVKEASKYGSSYYLFSFKGIYYSLFAKVYIFSSYITDINFFLSRNTYKVNLWHGIPLKKIEFDIQTKPLVKYFRNANLLYRLVYPSLHVKYNLVLSPSHFVSDYSFKSAFRLISEQIIVAPYPRLNYYLIADRNLKSSKSQEICYSKYKKKFFYAPTWRDKENRQGDFLENINFQALNDFLLKNNALLIVKLHSTTKTNLVNIDSLDSIKLIDSECDPLNILYNVDALITDYSSIYFDFLYLNKCKKPIIYFCFDLDEYLMGREMYFEYLDVTPGYKAKNFKDLLVKLSYILNNQDTDQYLYHRKQINSLFNYSGNNNIDFLVKEIINRVTIN